MSRANLFTPLQIRGECPVYFQHNRSVGATSRRQGLDNSCRRRNRHSLAQPLISMVPDSGDLFLSIVICYDLRIENERSQLHTLLCCFALAETAN